MTLIEELRSWIGFPKKDLDILLERAIDEIENLGKLKSAFAHDAAMLGTQRDTFRKEVDRLWTELAKRAPERGPPYAHEREFGEPCPPESRCTVCYPERYSKEDVEAICSMVVAGKSIAEAMRRR